MLKDTHNQPRGLSRQTIRVCGLLLLTLGIAGQAILQNALLGVNSNTMAELFKVMEDQKNMGIATIAILLMFIQACAIPIFCYLLVEGFLHTSSGQKYLLRVAGLALLTELPYNFAMTGKVIDLTSRNPVFGLVLCLAVLYLYRQYPGMKLKNFAIRALVFVFALIWAEMLTIIDGAACVIVVTTLYALRNKRQYQILAGCAAMFLGSVFSPYYLAAPITFLALNYYNGEKDVEAGNKIVNYLAYPVLLLVIGLVGKFAF